MSDAQWRGISRHGNVYRAEVSLGRRGTRKRKSFPLDTPPAVMQAWRVKAGAIAILERRSDVGTLAADARRYLTLVRTMPAIAARRNEINAWVAAFGHKRRDEITPYMVRLQCQAWATENRPPHPNHKATAATPYAAPTINKRLRALSNLYRVLDGKDAYNPTRDVEELAEPTAPKRSRSYDDVERVLAALPDRCFVKKGKTARSGTKIRLRCMAYSPITPIQLTRLQPGDIDLTAKPPRVRLPARAKGAGAAAAWVDLSPQGKAAYTDFVNAKLFGDFSRGNLWRAVGWACKKLGIPRMRPYDFRHSYLTMVYRITKSREAVSSFGQHASWDTSRQYVQDAEDEVRSAHAAKVNAAFTARVGGTVGKRRAALLGKTEKFSASKTPKSTRKTA